METTTPTQTPVDQAVTPEPELKALPGIADCVPKDLEPLRHCADQLLLAATGTSELNALELTVELKRAESFLQVIARSLRGNANEAFAKLQSEQDNKKQWAVHNGAAVVKKNTPRGSWQYPAFIDQLGRNLRAAQKAAQEDGTATKLQPTIDPNSTAAFSVTLSENFSVE
jgi:hypothetical protein